MPKRFLWLMRRDQAAFGYAANALVRFYLICGTLFAIAVTAWGLSLIWGRFTPGSLLVLSDILALMGLIIGGATITVTAIRIMLVDLHLILRGEIVALEQTLAELVESFEQSEEIIREHYSQAPDPQSAAQPDGASQQLRAGSRRRPRVRESRGVGAPEPERSNA